MSRKRPAATTKQKASPSPETAEQSDAPDDYAWFQHVGWWGDAHPGDVQDRLRAAQAEYDVEGPAGWLVVPGWFVRDYFGLESAFSEGTAEMGPDAKPRPWYQTPGWWGDDSPPVVASRVQAAAQEAGHDGWVLVPASYIEKYRAPANEEPIDEAALKRAQWETAVRQAADQRTSILARDILMELIRTKGDSTEWPRVAWERARKFVDEEARKP